MMATALSWWLGTDSLFIGRSILAISTGLTVIAFLKVRFVIHYFMEIRYAPLALRLACDIWVVGICVAILALYWFSPSA